LSFTINGVVYTPQTASQHAQNMLSDMNSQLTALSLPTLTATQSNALWWALLVQGSVDAQQDLLLNQAANSLNIALCDDDQVLNLLPIAGTSVIAASPSSVTLTVTASSAGCTVPLGSTVYSGTYIFSTTQVLTLGANASGSVAAICTTNGPVTVSANTLTAFNPTITGVSSVTNPTAAVVGRNIETVAQTRTRLLFGGANINALTGANTYLKNLAGITQANVFFNVATTTSVPYKLNGILSLANGSTVTSGFAYVINVVGTTNWTSLYGVVSPAIGSYFVSNATAAITGSGTCQKALPPRTAQIVLSGTSTLIASTYLDWMSSPTQGALSQNWTSPSGQAISVSYDVATTRLIYVQVNVLATGYLEAGYDNYIRTTIAGLNPYATIGQNVTTQTIANLFSTYTGATMVSYQISLDGSTWSNSVLVDYNMVPVYTASTVYIVINLV